ncbi:MAG: aminopeptidase N [Bacteroidetes bacterium]|nr:MAG: aminopeptidase N [Bacteroidota bacterium]
MRSIFSLLAAAGIFFTAGCDPAKRARRHNHDTLVQVNVDTLDITPRAPRVHQYAETRVNDLLHTKLEVSFDWQKRYLYGKATISARPYFYPVKTLDLDARGMEIKEVSMIDASGKKALEYKYAADVISIQLGREYTRDQSYTIFIDYVAKPDELKAGGSAAINSDKGLYFINPDGKEPNKPMQIWTQGETQASSAWFPTVDRPNERMTQEIYMTVEDKYVTLSNGVMTESVKNTDGTRTDRWVMNLPHAPYLVMMAVGDFAVVKDKWRDKEVSYYVEKKYEQYARAIFGRTPEMMEYFSKKLGVDYPWGKYAQICARDYVSGAMENTTATLHGEKLQQTEREMLDGNYEDYISHELFHQWFGDLVTCESWSNLPLNESFATYGEDLWEEFAHGSEAEEYHSQHSRDGYFREAGQGKKEALIRYFYEDKEDMFDSHSYNKGGQVLRMLRWYVGDEAFFASLKLYLESNRYKSVEIHNLRMAFEQVTGEDLSWYFNQWFLSPGHPVLDISYSYDETKKQEKLTLRQTQSSKGGVPAVYRLPMDVDVYANGTKTRHRIVMNEREQTFTFDVSSKPDLVNVDAAKRILCEKEDHKTKKEWAFQYSNAPLYVDRYEAIYGLAPREKTEKAQKDSLALVVLGKALDDKFWYLRMIAIRKLGKDVKPYKEKLIAMAKQDEKSDVRAEALAALADKVGDADLLGVYKNALNDRSYYVLGTAIGAITAVSTEEGMKVAAQYENEESESVKVSLCELYGKAGSDANFDFMVRCCDDITGYTLIGYIGFYGQYLTRCSDETVTKGLAVYEKMYTKYKSPFFRSFTGNSMETVRKGYVEKQKEYQRRIDELASVNKEATGIQALKDKMAKAKEMEKMIADKKKELEAIK